MSSLLPTPYPPDPVEGQLGHFDHSNWVKASLIALDDGTLHSNGGAISGNLAVEEITVDNPASEDAFVNLKGSANLGVRGMNAAGVLRWRMNLGDSTAEGGSNSGSLFGLFAYDDAGNQRHQVLKADRNSGLVEVLGTPTAAKGIATKEYVDATVPLGAIIAYGGSVAPAGWHLCNGTAHGSTALQALLGSTLTPDLSGRFIVGAGTGYNPKATGGVASNTLTPGQTATKAHGHTATSGTESSDHAHLADPPLTWSSDWNQNHQHYVSVGGGGHGHNSAYGNNWQGSTQDQNPAGTDYGPIGNNPSALHQTTTPGDHGHANWSDPANQGHAHNIDIGAFWTGGINANHAHTISVAGVSAANATEAIENRPPYYALVYIIKKV